jgi:hypothetical protein
MVLESGSDIKPAMKSKAARYFTATPFSGPF